jgi:hypothetical protein
MLIERIRKRLEHQAELNTCAQAVFSLRLTLIAN